MNYADKEEQCIRFGILKTYIRKLELLSKYMYNMQFVYMKSLLIVTMV